MDLHYKQEISVGLLVITAVALFAAGLTLLSGKSLGPRHSATVPVRFSDVNGLKAGDPVQISGVKVGRVDNVVLEDVGRVMVYLSVDPEVRPHVDARAAVSALDFFGAKFVDYSPGNGKELLKNGVVITGSREIALAEGAAGLTARATEALTAAQGILSERTADDIHMTMLAASRALDVFTKLGSGPQMEQAVGAVKTLQALAARVDSLLGNPAIKKSVDQLDELTGNVNQMTKELAETSKTLTQIMKKMENGQGTLGRAVNDTTLYHDLHDRSASMKGCWTISGSGRTGISM